MTRTAISIRIEDDTKLGVSPLMHAAAGTPSILVALDDAMTVLYLTPDAAARLVSRLLPLIPTIDIDNSPTGEVGADSLATAFATGGIVHAGAQTLIGGGL